MYIIKTNNLTKYYGKNRGIDDINICVKKGEIYGFIGPNGAGKSTTIKTLLNFTFPSKGQGKIFGKDIVKESKEIKKSIGYVSSEVKYYNDIKVKDIISYASSFFENCSKEKIEEVCSDLELELNKKIGDLSLGNKKKVAIAQALIHNPKLLILDEPTNGLDPLMQRKLFDILIKERNKGNTVFLSSHNLQEVENLCNRVGIIKEGKIIDVLNIEESNRNLSIKVCLTSKQINDTFIEDIGGIFIEKRNNTYVFIYPKEIDKLIEKLSKIKIDELTIDKQTLEETFYNYYEKE